MDLSTSEWALLVLCGLLFAWVVWVLLRNGILGPPKPSRSQDDKPKTWAPNQALQPTAGHDGFPGFVAPSAPAAAELSRSAAEAQFSARGLPMLRRSNSGILWVAALATVVGLAGQGQAAFITYTFSGTGTGDLGGSGFSNAPFRVTIQGDTTDIFLLEPGILVIVNLPATIEIAGLGVAAFSDPVYVFNNQTNRVVGFGDYGFMDFQGDFWDQFSPPLATYGLDTSYGPITTSASTFAIFADTDRGFLSVEQIGPATFQATVVAVPEPSSVALFSLGLVCLARPRRLVGAISARVGLRAVA